MTKQEALAEIEQKLETMQQALKEAQELADEHGLSFKASFGGTTMQGDAVGDATYYGKEDDDGKGYWYWQNSSMNC